MDPFSVGFGLLGCGDEFGRLELVPVRDCKRLAGPDGFGLAVRVDFAGPATIEWPPPTAAADLLDCMLRCDGETERVEFGTAVEDLLECICCVGAVKRDERTGVLFASGVATELLEEGKEDKPPIEASCLTTILGMSWASSCSRQSSSLSTLLI